jgi:D-galactarolactone cycloisomerase
VTIERVEAFLLDFPLERRRSFSTGGNDSRGAALVRVTDTDGAVGWGETYSLPAGIPKLAELGRLLIGRDPDDAAGNWALIWGTAGGDGFATGAVSIALDDLRGRRRGVPVSALYGGARRTRARAYASSEGYVPGQSVEAAWLAEAQRAVDAGFTGFKLRIGRESVREEIAAATAVRRAHPDLELMADGNGAYTARQAIDVGRALHELDFAWLEEPLPTAHYAGYERLRDALPLALSGGESAQSRGEGIGLVDRGAFDIIQPDVSICGGIGEAAVIAGAARLAGIETQPHACNGAIGLAASLQLLAVLPDPVRLPGASPMLEHDFGPNPARTDLLATPLLMRDGWFDIPTGPGLGIDVDEGFVRDRAVVHIRAT